LSPDAPSGYEEVREKLLARGYLSGRVERFLLAGFVRRGGTVRSIAGTAFRAGALGGPILGALLAAAAVAANRPMLGAADGFVLWAWFVIPAAAALALLDLLAAGTVSILARRRGARPSDTLRAALLAGIPTLAYLVLLRTWGEGEGSLGGDLLFLAGAVAATLVVAWLAGVVSVAGIVGRTGEVPVRPGRGARWVLAAVLAGVAAVALFALGEPVAAGGSEPSPFDPVPAERPLFLLAIDGLDGDLVEALAETGRVDGLLDAMARGAVFPIRPRGVSEPPEVWTTVATGTVPTTHGVRGAGVATLPGVATPLRAEKGPLPLGAALRFLLPARTAPVSGAGRSVLALWEIVGLRLPVAAVDWWASWPAPADGAGPRGYVVTDRVLAKLLSGAEPDRDTAPAGLFGRLRAEFDETRRRARERFETEIAPTEAAEGLRAFLWESFLIDFHALAATDLLLRDREVGAAFVYLPGLDILRHRLDVAEREADLAFRLESRRALERYVGWLDGVVKGTSGTFLLVADPGRSAGPASEGFVVVRGGPAEGQCVGPSIGLVDVAPLALRLAGFPASREMPGALPGRCLGGIEELPRVATFGRRAVSADAARSEYDPEMVERLKSLGYLK
jgi:hypothetical protein